MQIDLLTKENFSRFSDREQQQLFSVQKKVNEIMLDYADRKNYVNCIPGLIRSFIRIYNQSFTVTQFKKAVYPLNVEIKTGRSVFTFELIKVKTRLVRGIDFTATVNKLLRVAEEQNITVKKILLK